jgi:hypothetical protein
MPEGCSPKARQPALSKYRHGARRMALLEWRHPATLWPGEEFVSLKGTAGSQQKGKDDEIQYRASVLRPGGRLIRARPERSGC